MHFQRGSRTLLEGSVTQTFSNSRVGNTIELSGNTLKGRCPRQGGMNFYMAHFKLICKSVVYKHIYIQFLHVC